MRAKKKEQKKTTTYNLNDIIYIYIINNQLVSIYKIGCQTGCWRLSKVVSCQKKKIQPYDNLLFLFKVLFINILGGQVVGCQNFCEKSSKHFFFIIFLSAFLAKKC